MFVIIFGGGAAATVNQRINVVVTELVLYLVTRSDYAAYKFNHFCLGLGLSLNDAKQIVIALVGVLVAR